MSASSSGPERICVYIKLVEKVVDIKLVESLVAHLMPALKHDVIEGRGTTLRCRHSVTVLHLNSCNENGRYIYYIDFIMGWAMITSQGQTWCSTSALVIPG